MSKRDVFRVTFGSEEAEAAKKSDLKIGDRVHVKAGNEHSYMHKGKVGTVREVAGSPAVSIAFDDDPDRVARWYVGDELVPINKDAQNDASNMSQNCSAADNNKKFGGQDRSKLGDSDFLYPATKSFPIVTVKDVQDAIHDFGRSNTGDTYAQFIKKLWDKAKSKGLTAGIPQSTRDQYNLK